MAMPVAQAAPSRRPIPIDRRAPRGIPGEILLPWHRSASIAKAFGRLPIAMTEVAGSSSVVPKNACHLRDKYVRRDERFGPRRNFPITENGRHWPDGRKPVNRQASAETGSKHGMVLL